MSTTNTLDLQKLYTEGRYLANNPGWHVEDSAWKARQIIKAFRKGKINPRFICDIGCGAGEVIRCLANELPDCKFHGYELSPQAYALAKLRETEQCRYFQLDGLTYPQRHDYDVAMAIDVVEHVEDYFAFVRKLKRVANHKVLHVPLEMSALGTIVNQQAWARRTAGHIHFFSSATLVQALHECHVSVSQFAFTKPFINDALTYRNRHRIMRQIAKLGLSIPRQILYMVSPEFCARTLGGCSALIVCE